MVMRRVGWRGVCSRVVAATLGSYALVSALVAAAARLPLAPVDAILYPALLAIPVLVALAIACFAVRSSRWLWVVLIATTLAALAIRWWLI